MRNIRKFNPELTKVMQYTSASDDGGLISITLSDGHGMPDDDWKTVNSLPIIYEGGDGTGYYDDNAATIVMRFNEMIVGYIFYWLDPPDDWVRIEDVALLPDYLWLLRYLLAAPLEISGKVRLELIDQHHFETGDYPGDAEIKDSCNYATFVAALNDAGYEKVNQGVRGSITDMYLLTKEK